MDILEPRDKIQRGMESSEESDTSHGEDIESETDESSPDYQTDTNGEGSETETGDKDGDNSNSEESEDGTDEEDDNSSDLEDNSAFQDWLDEAKEETDEIRSIKYEKYMDEGMGEEYSKTKAHAKTMWALKNSFFDKYKDFLASQLHLKDNQTHQEVVSDLEKQIAKGADIKKALKRVIPKYQAQFDGLFQQSDDEEEEVDSES